MSCADWKPWPQHRVELVRAAIENGKPIAGLAAIFPERSLNSIYALAYRIHYPADTQRKRRANA